MFEIGDLLYILHWDDSGPMYGAPPALVIDRYEAVPKAFINDDEENVSEFGSKKQTVYDVLLGGELEVSISESWLHAMADSDYGPADETIVKHSVELFQAN
ncbi:MAG: hypothetical protein CML56_01180 [Rhodobacteraceae bacterium]|nr:hypothetical protein [Paracoccaceae bacterium]